VGVCAGVSTDISVVTCTHIVHQAIDGLAGSILVVAGAAARIPERALEGGGDGRRFGLPQRTTAGIAEQLGSADQRESI
jgi:hypothetical protein